MRTTGVTKNKTDLYRVAGYLVMFEILLLMGCSNNVEEVSKGLRAPGLYVTLSSEIQAALKSQILLSNGKFQVQMCIDDDVAQCESITPVKLANEVFFQWEQTSGGNRAQHTYQVEILYTSTGTNETMLLAVANKTSSEERVFIKAQELYSNPYDAAGILITDSPIDSTKLKTLDFDVDSRSNLAELMEGGNPKNSGPTFLSPATATLAEGKNNLSDYLFYTGKALSPRMQSPGSTARQPVTYGIIKDATDSRIFDLLVINPVSGELSVKANTATNNQPAFEVGSSANNTYVITLAATDQNTSTTLPLTLTVTDIMNLAVKLVAKALYFEWEPVNNSSGDPATYYKLFENPDGKSGFSEIPTASHIVGNTYLRNIALYLNDMSNAKYYLEAYEQSTDPNQSDTLLRTSDILQIKPQFVKALDYVGYVKASDTQPSQAFGSSVSLSGDGYSLAVGVYADSSNTGAVYLYTREPGLGSDYGPWTFAAKLTAPNAGVGDYFGYSVALSADGEVLAVGAYSEDNAATGTAEPGDGDPCTGNNPPTCAASSGAVYVFQRPLDGSGKSHWSAWTGWDTSMSLADHKVAYLKAPNAEAGDQFGGSVTLSADGEVLAVGAVNEDNAANGTAEPRVPDSCPPGIAVEFPGCASNSGAVYIFHRPLDNTDKNNWAAWTGWDIKIPSDNTLASHRVAYLKAPNAGTGDLFGASVNLSADGEVLVVGAYSEDNAATGTAEPGNPDLCTGIETTGCASGSGAVYVYQRPLDDAGNKNWAAWSAWNPSQLLAERNVAYIKSPNAGDGDYFGFSMALSADGTVLAVGARYEDNTSTGTAESNSTDLCTGTENNCAADSGAVYVFQRPLDDTGNNNWAAWVGWDNSNPQNAADNSLAAHKVAYLKAPNAGAGDFFGGRVALSADGAVLAVGAIFEDNSATGTAESNSTVLCTGVETNCYLNYGAVYIFQRPLDDTGYYNWAAWTGWDSSNPKNAADNSLAAHKVAYLKAPNAGSSNNFGSSVALNADGAVLAVGASGEASDFKSQVNTQVQGVPQQQVNGIPTPVINNNAKAAGSVYLF